MIIHNRFYFILDLLLIPAGVALSFLIWVNTPTLSLFLPQMKLFIILNLLIKPVVFYLIGFYQRLWRYASIGELVLIINGAALATLLSALTIIILGLAFDLPATQAFPRSVIAIDFFLTIMALGASRFYPRLVRLRWSSGLKQAPLSQTPRRVLIVGAGNEGVTIAREIIHQPGRGIVPVGFVDDDLQKLGLHIHGIPVLGPCEAITRLVREWHVDEIIIALPGASGKTIRAVIHLYESIGVGYKLVPGFEELLNGQVSVSRRREVKTSDLSAGCPSSRLKFSKKTRSQVLPDLG